MTAHEPHAGVPSGFVAVRRIGAFAELVGDLWWRPGPSPEFGAWVDTRHCNQGGIAHGGYLATLADLFSGATLMTQLGGNHTFVTSDLVLHYLQRVPPLTWVQSQIDRIHISGRKAQVLGTIVSAQTLVLAYSARFALRPLNPTPTDHPPPY